MTENAAAAAETIVPANDQQPGVLKTTHIHLWEKPTPVVGHNLVRNDEARLPEFWNGDFDRVDLLPIPSGCYGQEIFRLFASRLNLAAVARPFFLEQSKHPVLVGKDLLFLGSEFQAPLRKFAKCTYVWGIKAAVGTHELWNFKSTERLDRPAHAVVFKV